MQRRTRARAIIASAAFLGTTTLALGAGAAPASAGVCPPICVAYVQYLQYPPPCICPPEVNLAVREIYDAVNRGPIASTNASIGQVNGLLGSIGGGPSATH